MGKVTNFIYAILIGTFIITGMVFVFNEGASEQNYNITTEPRYDDFYDSVGGNRSFISNFSNTFETRVQESKGDSIISNAFLSIDMLSLLKAPLSLISVLLNLLTAASTLIGIPPYVTGTIITLILVALAFMIINAFRGGTA